MKLRFTRIALLGALAAASGAANKHAFTADDWAAIHSAWAVGVAPDGATILYVVAWGGEKGPSHEEWRLIAKDGTNQRKLDLPEHFSPAGFTRDGGSLYGVYEVNKLPQLAVFALAGIQKTSTPTLVVTLPAGIRSARLSPDGSRFGP
jgi:hypothetical protein